MGKGSPVFSKFWESGLYPIKRKLRWCYAPPRVLFAFSMKRFHKPGHSPGSLSPCGQNFNDYLTCFLLFLTLLPWQDRLWGFLSIAGQGPKLFYPPHLWGGGRGGE